MQTPLCSYCFMIQIAFAFSPHLFFFPYEKFDKPKFTSLQKTTHSLISGIDKMHWSCEYVTLSYI